MRMKDYQDYFLNLCVNHPALQHDDEAGKHVFLPISIDEALGNFRSKIKSKDYFFHLISYTWDTSENKNADPRKNAQAGFILGKYHKKTNEAYLQALDDSEKVVEDFIGRIIYDSREGHAIFNYSINEASDFNCLPTDFTGDVTYSGWIVTFLIRPSVQLCATGNNAVAWIDMQEP